MARDVTVPRLGDWTPSDSGPWMTLWDEEYEVPHVVPGFGPTHTLSMRCWCHPIIDADYVQSAVSHNVGH